MLIDKFDENRKPAATGMGCIATPDGRIITSHQVIQSAPFITARLTNGDVYDSVEVIDIDVRRNLAIIQIKAVNLPSLVLANSDGVKSAQVVFHIEYAGGSKFVLRKGMVTAIRSLNGSRSFEVVPASNARNLGTPLLNDRGQVLAIPTASQPGAQNAGLVLPSNYARGLLDTRNSVPLAAYYAATRKTRAAAQKVPTPVPDPGPAGVIGGIIGGAPGGVSAGAPPPPPPLSAPTAGPSIRFQNFVSGRIGSWTPEDEKLALGGPTAESDEKVGDTTASLSEPTHA